MASNNNGYGQFNAMTNGRASRRAASSDYSSDTSLLLSNQDFRSTQPSPMSAQQYMFLTRQPSNSRDVSDSSLMNSPFRWAQQDPITSITYTGNYQQDSVNHRNTEGREEYVDTPESLGYGMSNMTAVGDQPNAGAVGFDRSRDTSFGNWNRDANFEGRSGTNIRSDFDPLFFHRILISKWPKRSGKFYIFKCYECSDLGRPFDNASLTGNPTRQEIDDHNAHKNGLTKAKECWHKRGQA
ncbi:hypothetical protein BKA64DRAFT_699237 [Cadophora sp. MPI-SDFR-AT-0126]|nr:hypothetical protein BKA64DRAFT_699237 [Leotiomycetes sp. MPI-SDFR-AT-0126]